MKPMARGLAICAAMFATACAAFVLTPRERVALHSVELEEMVPRHFGDWSEESGSVAQVSPEIAQSAETGYARPAYDQVLMRTYRRHSDGAEVMLALAYGRQQRQEFKVHRPELCYYSQGYDVSPAGLQQIELGGSRHIEAQALLARSRWRLEYVTYWIRIGDQVSITPWRSRLIIAQEGFAGRVPDGILVRTSSLMQTDADAARALGVQRRFLSDFYASLSGSAKRVVAGT
jgi:EpsI family protein